jgi:uncharacterized membrane protein
MYFGKDYFFPYHLWSIFWLVLVWIIIVSIGLYIWLKIKKFKEKIKEDNLNDLKELERKLSNGEITKLEFYKEKRKLKL